MISNQLRQNLLNSTIRLPKEKNIDAILKQITHASSRAGVDLKLIEPLKIKEGGIYKRFPIKLHIKSTFDNCFLFFLQLENLQRILQLESINMKADDKSAEIETEMLILPQRTSTALRWYSLVFAISGIDPDCAGIPPTARCANRWPPPVLPHPISRPRREIAR